MATQALANWSVNLTYASLPSEVKSAAVRSFYNWAGCTVQEGGIDVDAMHAALFNGIASHVHDYDDTHLDTIIHPTGPVASALLAITESLDRPVTGEEFITALVAGVEAECKVGLAVWPSHYDVGWHITSSTGAIGAAVAVSKLLGLNATQTAHAIGLAATQVTGLREMFGSHTKSFHPGRAAQNGLVAAVLAEEDYTSSTQALEAERGWANVVSSSHELDVQIGSLAPSGRWEIVHNAFKPFPCGIVVHPVIDGCILLHEELERSGLSIDQIVEVQAEVHPLVLELTGKTAPKDGLEGKFSVYHGGAVGLLFGKATPAQYEDGVVTDSRVVGVRNRIKAKINENFKADECHLTALLRKESGENVTIEKHVSHAVWSLERPMTDAQLVQKFVDQCIPVLGQEKTGKASQWCWGLEKQCDVRGIKAVL
ncbi:uncharacterized protein N7484_003328 [Penicillium longicatenatum]|uniref:uncharacterized protein n=1 Tax=Penicillium longicatenatum TaxID=1561947 RepID=UPI002546F9A9|nr:uncharacterized protein N7484_003328 [Penicillium longicatenatum]KAJ5649605.1 hypothetical protein N7484_003328 [Penicillium longicatenatum]